MKRFVYDRKVPKNCLSDVKELQKFIQETMHIKISLYDVYSLWSGISESWCAGWLFIDTCPEGQTREDFLLSEMCIRGYFEEV